jgi:hypothetical protein
MKTTIDMAREAGADIGTSGRWLMTPSELDRFEAFVRADQREIDAKVCDDRAFQFFSESFFFVEMHGLADAIRNRGNT